MRMRRREWLLSASSLLGQPVAAGSGLAALLCGLSQDAGAAPGLDSSWKALLKQCAQQAGDSLGANDGLWRSGSWRLPLPPLLAQGERLLKLAGQKQALAELHEGMNHAGEQAIGLAKPILRDAVQSFTLADAGQVMKGGDRALTEVFEKHARQPLAGRFEPIMQQALARLSVTAKYDRLMDKVQGLGLRPQGEDAHLHAYATRKSLDALFGVMGEQEKHFREHPSALGQDLLKRVLR